MGGSFTVCLLGSGLLREVGDTRTRGPNTANVPFNNIDTIRKQCFMVKLFAMYQNDGFDTRPTSYG
jgi:hypothetical protein